MELKKLLEEDFVMYKRSFARKLGSPLAALYLQQIIYTYYDRSKGKPFFKFRDKCEHYAYKDGDSWEEELCMSKRTQLAAFKLFGWSPRGTGYLLNEETAIVVSKTDGNKFTWYYLNETNLKTFLERSIDDPSNESLLRDTTSRNSPNNESQLGKQRVEVSPNNESSRVSIQKKVIQKKVTKNSSTHTLRDNESEQPSLSSYSDPDEKVEKVVTKKKVEYSVEFNLVWTTYNPPVPTAKGKKPAASKAHIKAREILSNDDIMNALSLYMSDEYAFGRSPCHLSTFLNGIVSNTKYRDSYIDNRYDKTVQRQEGPYGKGKTAMQHYGADFTLQGPLDREKIIDRTNELDFNMSQLYGDKWSIKFIQDHPREEWIKYLGDQYVAFKVKSRERGDATELALFTIDELRKNLYVHVHGYVWSDKFEQHFLKINKEAKKQIVAPVDKNIIEAELLAPKKENFTEEELFG